MDEVCTCVYQVRAQLAGEAAGGKKVSVVEIGKTILRNEGPKGLYAGLSAAAARRHWLPLPAGCTRLLSPAACNCRLPPPLAAPS